MFLLRLSRHQMVVRTLRIPSATPTTAVTIAATAPQNTAESVKDPASRAHSASTMCDEGIVRRDQVQRVARCLVDEID